MKVMVDLNVLLDVLQKRAPFYEASASLLDRVLGGKVTGVVPAHLLTTIHYVLGKHAGSATADEVIDWLLVQFEVAAADKAVFLRARLLGIGDFEDSVVASLAESTGCDFIVTRNVPDFERSPVPAVTPAEFLASHAD
jgi:predicted nucleic acid-binding protein